MKQFVFIDGENFVHGLVHILRSKKLIHSRDQLSRINMKTLLAEVCDTEDSNIRYYATRIQLPPTTSELYLTVEKMRKWSAKWTPYLANQNVNFVKAGLLKARSSKRCSHCKKRTEVLLEKGVDVRLGVDIAAPAEKGAVIHLFSSDSDLLPAIAVARNNGVKIIYLAFEGNENHAIRRASNQMITIKKSAVKKAYEEAKK